MALTLLKNTGLAVVALSMSAFSAQAAPITYVIDPSHTNVVWSISHFDASIQNGKFYAPTGEIILDEAKPENSSVKVNFDINKLTTGVEALDTHLKSKEFFDAAAFPQAEFTSTKVISTGKNTANVTGNLTLHGVTKPATLNVTLNKIFDNMFKKHTAGFSATASIKRSDFGIVAYLPGLGDDVTLNIQAEANVPAK